MAKEEKKGQPKVVSVKKEFVNPDNIGLQYSNDMTVTHTNREFFVSFWLTEPPTILDQSDIEGIKKVESKLVAKLAMTPEQARAVYNALGNNISKFDKKKEKKE